MSPNRPRRARIGLRTTAFLVIAAVGAAGLAERVGDRRPSGAPSARQALPVGPEPQQATDGAGGNAATLEGAMQGLELRAGRGAPVRRDLVRAADVALGRSSHAREPFVARSVDDPFVADALAAYTLALAGHGVPGGSYSSKAVELLDSWVSTMRTVGHACPDSGACETSLVLSRAAPALVYAADLLVADGRLDAAWQRRFHDWLRAVVLPAASERRNNWGDAGTYLRVVLAVELGDPRQLDAAIAMWRKGIDLVARDGHIPEETRRGASGLMYSQEALSYKVAVAELASRIGIDLWTTKGRRGGDLRTALDVTAAALSGRARWSWYSGAVRMPDPSPMWVLVDRRWPGVRSFAALADRSGASSGRNHSAIVWTLTWAAP